MPLHFGKRNVALVEQPTLIERKPLTRGTVPHRGEHGSESNKKGDQEFFHWFRAP